MSPGGRCICSDKIKEFDKTIAKIEQLNQQSYNMATLGVDAVNAGASLDSIPVIGMVDINIKSSDDFGDALFLSAYEICATQIPECASQMDFVRSVYGGRVRSDCAAYNNALAVEMAAATERVRVATTAVKDAVVARVESANKYDLGGCSAEYKKCMQTTAGCGADFSACVSVAMEDTISRVRSRSKVGSNDEAISIRIAPATYDILSAKAPICESVLNQCTRVRDSVWNTFLRENASVLRNAELIAQNKARQECTTNISNCFQRACRDNIDPNDPDGSYDLCLTRPGSMLNLCRVPLEKCGVDVTNESEAAKSPIWDFVVARLAGMRVDACTTQVKECIQSDDRCGADFSKCIGLSADTIIRMCPYDKLTGCQKVYGTEDVTGDAVYENLTGMIDGLITNIDNQFYAQCENAMNESLLRVCGDVNSCNDAIMSGGTGARSLKYMVCEFTIGDKGEIVIDYTKCRDSIDTITDQELGLYTGVPKNFVVVIEGTIYWESVQIDDDGNIDIDAYWADVDMTNPNITKAQRDAVNRELSAVATGLRAVMDAVESDPVVDYCMTGRTVPGLPENIAGTADARFPNLTKQRRTMLATKAFRQIRDNYYARYEQLNERMISDYNKIAMRMKEVTEENEKYVRREMARQSCVSLADFSKIARTPHVPSGWIGTAIVAVVVIAVTVVVCVCTFGVGGVGVAGAAAVSSAATASAGASAGAAAAGAVAAGTSTVMGVSTGVAAGLTGATAMAATSAGVAAGTAAGAAVAGAAAAAGISAGAASAIGTGIVLGAGAAAAGVAAAGNAIDNAIQAGSSAESVRRETVGSGQSDSWNYKETVTTNFDMETLSCRKCIRIQNCARAQEPVFGKLFCKTWDEPVETCSTIQF